MENNHREQSLGNKLRDYREPVDQSALWQGIKHQIPVKKKKTYWPIPLVFILGAALGYGLTELSYKNTYNTLNFNNKQLTKENLELQQVLKTCFQQNTKESFVENKAPVLQESTRSSFRPTRIISSWQQPIKPLKNTLSQATPENEVKNTDSIQGEKSAVLPAITSDVTSLPTHRLELIHASSWNVEFSPNYTRLRDAKSPLVWLFELSGGPSIVSDQELNQKESLTSKHQSLFHAQMDAGIQKNLLGKLYGNLGISYQFVASQQTYQTSAYENIFITDTMGVFIGTDGLTRVDVGEVLAQKWISKTGQAFHTRHMISVRPGLEYEVYHAKGKHLSLGLSIAIPVWFKNTGSLVNDQSGKQALTQNQFLRSDWPWSIGVYYQWPMQYSSLGLLLRVHHDKQKIVFNDNVYARNFWLPQAGMRILF